MKLPAAVIAWVHAVFTQCNERVTRKLCENPNIAEEWLDYSWIDVTTDFASPRAIDSDWTVKIESHFIGALRHFGRWEIADIGILLFVKTGNVIRRSKVVLLQSKRLYPSTGRVSEQGITDYHYGFARLADPEDLKQSIAVQADFEFSDACRFGALIAGSPQVHAIDDFQREKELRVYYQFYNPWVIPFEQRVPITERYRPANSVEVGIRVLPSTPVHALLADKQAGYRPRMDELSGPSGKPGQFGWALQDFMAYELLSCNEGSVFESIADERIQDLFYRRTGPISSAIAITIEGPANAAV